MRYLTCTMLSYVYITSSSLIMLTITEAAQSQSSEQSKYMHGQQQQRPQRRTLELPREGEIKVRDCEKVTANFCVDVGYTETGMPNRLGHLQTEDAVEQLNTFSPLFEYGCGGLDSNLLRVFFCSAYLPMCTEKHVAPVGPCRPLCEVVKNRCEPVLLTFGFSWPVGLNCSIFQQTNEEDRMCMNPGVTGDPQPSGGNVPQLLPSSGKSTPPAGPGVIRNEPGGGSKGEISSCNHFRHPERYVIINSTKSCALQCHADAAFTQHEKQFSEVWLLICSLISSVASLVTVATFLINSSRFTYPERTVFLMAFCNLIACTSCFIRLMAGRSAVACRASQDTDARQTVEVLIQGGLENSNCTVVFILAYYFTMAAAVWWVILTITWGLVVSKVVRIELLSRYSTLYHVIAWTLPAIPTVIVLILRTVDADELTAMCLVGNWNKTHLLTLVISPLCLFLSLGVISLGLGAISLCRRTSNESEHSNSMEEMPVRRLTVFALVYSVSQAWVLAIACYEYTNRESWYEVNKGLESLPAVAILHVKLFCSLSVGIICFAAICNKNTVESWITACRRILHRRGSTSTSSACCKMTKQLDKSAVILLPKNNSTIFQERTSNATTSFSFREDAVVKSGAGLVKSSKSNSIVSRTDESGLIYQQIPQHTSGYSINRAPSSEGSNVRNGLRCNDPRRSPFDQHQQIYTVS